MGRLTRASVFVVCLVWVACDRRDEDESGGRDRMGPDGTIHLTRSEQGSLGLSVEPATDGVVPSVRTRLGRVIASPVDDGILSASVPSRVAAVEAVLLGTEVAAGTKLVEVTPVLNAGERVTIGAQAADLEGQIRATEQELAFREAAAARARELGSSSIVSTQAVEEAATSVQATRARLDAFRRARSIQEAGGHRTIPVFAPIAGTLVSLDAHVGAIVGPGDVLARVVGHGERWIDVAMSPEEASGATYRVLSGTEWLDARLVARGGAVAPDGTRRDRIAMPGAASAGLLPGMTVSVEVAASGASGPVVPASAVLEGVDGDYVFLEVRPETFAARAVHVLGRNADRARIDGIAVGTRVVTHGAVALRGEGLRASLRGAE